MKHASLLLLAGLLAAPTAHAQVARHCEGRFVVNDVSTASATRNGQRIGIFVLNVSNNSNRALTFNIRPATAGVTIVAAEGNGTLAARETGRRLRAVEMVLGPYGGPTRATDVLWLIIVSCA